MDSDENKKVLFVIGMDHDPEQFLRQVTHIHSENILLLQIYGPEISQSFSDLMRDIIIAVYQENAEEIFVVGTADDRKKPVDAQDLLNKIFENEGLQENIQTVEYLFKNCTPEFPGVTLSEWLEGSKTSTEGIRKSVEIIRHHPLMPSYVRVQGLLMNKENGQLSEIGVC
ncbi:carbonic anhydrase [Fodinisporobacter ferrooxydans]|uniref:Carbonic anhydrase n=1 Tax=Fodinisporobacter ferrooxydans TaxID=2901836 RepID=A0ABY4CPI0_9BACL|nr:carbonic anhydrase [Alicyclobacillaceae bacterium MYW30-H2]